MLKNYILTALRNIRRNKLSAFLNISGLAAGILSCLFIYLYVSDELSYDRDFSMSDKIYRIQCYYTFDDQEDKFGIVPFPTVSTLLKDFPEIESGTSMFIHRQNFFKKGDQVFELEYGYYADTNFFEVFDFPFIHGDRKTALLEPNSVVLAKSDAQVMFGDANPVGEMLEWNKLTLKVTGVYDDKAFNTHMETGAMISMKTASPAFQQAFSSNWGNNNSFGYIVLKDEKQAEAIQPALDATVEKYQLAQWKTLGFTGKIEWKAEPLKDIHFNNYLIYDTSKKGNLTYVYVFSVVAVIILIIACINFINLATAMASARAREVGMRKVLGADRRQLVMQFIGEAFIISAFASIIALALLELLLPGFNYITGKEITSTSLFTLPFMLTLIGLILFIGFVAGSYPAFYVSALPVTSIFRNARTSLGKSGMMRKVLVTTQFALSVAMIIATLTVLSQLTYMRDKDLGFSKENMMVVSLPPGDSTQALRLKALRNELATVPQVETTARSAHIPGKIVARLIFRVNTGMQTEDKAVATMFTDGEFLDMMHMELADGRYFSNEDFTSQNISVALVNETAVKAWGWEDPLNEKVVIPGDTPGNDQEIRIVGVIKDFHYASLHQPIEPLMVVQQNPNSTAGNLMIRLNTDDYSAAIAAVEHKWNDVFPDKTFEYTFLDDNFRQLYLAEEKMFNVFIYFASIAIILCCLGLYGLSAYTTQQRTKEIGIRKVMGASVRDILILLNKDFMKLVVVAILIAFPVAWYVMSEWLGNFAYRTEISPAFFAIAAVFAALVTVLTVTLRAMNTALKDPVASLRYE